MLNEELEHEREEHEHEEEPYKQFTQDINGLDLSQYCLTVTVLPSRMLFGGFCRQLLLLSDYLSCTRTVPSSNTL